MEGDNFSTCLFPLPNWMNLSFSFSGALILISIFVLFWICHSLDGAASSYIKNMFYNFFKVSLLLISSLWPCCSRFTVATVTFLWYKLGEKNVRKLGKVCWYYNENIPINSFESDVLRSFSSRLIGICDFLDKNSRKMEAL